MITPLFLASTPVVASAGRIEEIRQDWNLLQPKYFDSPYSQKPNLNAPFQKGQLQTDFYQDGLNLVMFVRKLAGLPHDIEPRADLNEKAQSAAVLLSQMSAIAHQAALPKGMDMDFYSQASIGLKQGNISRQTGSAANLPQLIFDQVYDNRENAIHVGHRRWVLNPRLKYVGLGFVTYEGGFKNDGVLMAQDQNRDAYQFNHVAWPAAGDFPIEFCPPEIPWSVTLDPSVYQTPKPGTLKVTWKSPTKSITFTPQGQDDLANKQNFSVINNQGYGVPNAIIFRPPVSHEYKPGDTYNVEITGLKKSNGDSATLSYSVRLFSLTN